MSKSERVDPIATAPKRRKWRRRFLWLCVLAVAFRIGLAYGAAPALRFVAGMFELGCDVESIEFDVLTGEARIYGLSLWHDDADASAPILELEYAGVDVAALELLRANLVVRRIEADGLDLYVARDEFARWNIAPVIQQFVSDRATTATEELRKTQEEHTGPLEFGLPFKVEALRGTHLRLHLDDALADPPLDTTITALVRVSDLGDRDRVQRLSISAAGPQILDIFDFKVDALVSGPEVDTSIDLRLRGFHPQPLAGYFELVGIAPSAERLDADLHVELDARATDAGGNHITVAVSDARWNVDGNESLALDRWKTAFSMEPGPRLHIEPIAVEGARAAAERDADGRLTAAGFTYVGMPAATDDAATPQAADEPTASDLASSDASSPTRLIDLLPFALQLDGLSVTNCAVNFTDRVQRPAQEFAIALDGFQLSALDSTLPEQPTAFSANLRAPGTLSAIMSQGSISPFAASPALEAELHTEGADLAQLEPYLEALGLESEWNDGRFSAQFHARADALDDGNWSIDLGARELRLAEGEAETPWFALAEASLSGLVIDAKHRRIALADGTLSGLRSAALRLEDGGWSALGVRTRSQSGDIIIHDGGAPAPVDDTTASTPDSPAPDAAQDVATSAAPWRIEVGKLTFDDTDFAFRDDAISPTVEFHFDDFGVSVEGLALGGDANRAADRARVRAYLREPGLADSLELTGDLTSQPGVLGLDWQLELTGAGLAPLALKPYLDAARIEIVDATSAITAQLDGSMSLEGGALDLDARVSDFAFGPVDAPFVSADAFELGGLHVTSELVRVEALTFTRPLLRAGRRADGALLVAGLRIGGDEPELPAAAENGDAVTEAAANTDEPATPKLEVHVEDDSDSDPFAALDTLAMQLELGHFGIEEARFVWRDEAVDPVLDSVIVFRSTVDGLALRPGAADADFSIGWHVEGEEKATRIEGQIVLDPRAIELDARVIGEHIDFERLAVYFPPGISSDSSDARFETDLRAELTAIEAGGRSLVVECTDLHLTDSSSDEPALALASARLSAPRIDGAADVLEIAELTTSGLELRVHRDLQSRWHALGLIIDPAAQAPDTDVDVTLPPEPEVRTVSRQPVAADADLPTIRLGKVDLGIDRLIVTDEFQGEGAEPLVISMRATTSEPQLLMSTDPSGLPPYAVRLSARISPLIEELAAELSLAPFAPQPNAKGTLSMRGLDGHGVVELLPRLAPAIDTAGLPSGEFDGKFEVVLDARRRGLTRFEFKRGFGVDLLATDLAFRAEPGGEVLLGLESLEVNAPRINAARQEIVVQRIEIVEPRARLARDANGIHLLGLVIDPVALQAALDAGPVHEPSTAAVATTPPPATPQTPQGELRIDELLVSGVDFEFKDESYAPPLYLPLTGLSVEVSRFSSRSFVEKLPVRFNTYVEAGNVDLGEGFEPAPFFGEATMSGQISFYPALEGWVDAGLSELALRSLRGPAAASGVTISDGSMDGSVRVRLRGERGMTIDAKSTFRDLSVTEPSDGPISRYLGIAMPLESALFALRNTDGEVVLNPPSIQISSSGITTAEITRVATTAIAKEITLAVARAPLRMTKGVADAAGALTESIPLVGGVTGGLFGGVSGLFGGGSDEPLPEIGSVEFLPGDVNVMPEEAHKLEEAIRRLRDDKKRVIVLTHEFTTADLERALELANPSAEDCRELVTGLRRKKAELYRIRDEVTAEARARLLTGQEDQAQLSIDRLRVIDSELGRTEVAIDQTLELLQPGAERRREKRGRKAALTIAEARLEQIVAALRAAGISKLDSRLEVRRPRPRPVESEDQLGRGGRIKLGVR